MVVVRTFCLREGCMVWLGVVGYVTSHVRTTKRDEVGLRKEEVEIQIFWSM